MPDPRIEKLAKVLTHYSLSLRKGDLFQIQGSPVCEPLIREVFREAVKLGANPFVDMIPEGLDEILFKTGSEAQIKYVSPLAMQKMKKVNARLAILASSNTKALSGVDPKRMAWAQVARKPLMKVFMDRAAKGKLRWCLTQYACHASAQDADKSLAEYEDFVFGAGFINDRDPVKRWQTLSKSQEKLAKRLNKARTVRIKADGTDFTVGVKGRKWINCDGKLNFPDGEVFTGPVEDSASGTVKFSFPAVHLGREVVGIRLTFDKGKVVKAEADKGQDFLQTILRTDAGASYLGEFAIATNYNIQQYSRNTLFDEKMGGTIHMALGKSYPETGGKNVSGLHWDIVCDLRKGGEIWVDGELIQRNGKFLNKQFPQP
jgi:aminopeptidase